jgi:stage V sporulation protein D (sporulation-specific penicillin-binding protein)
MGSVSKKRKVQGNIAMFLLFLWGCFGLLALRYAWIQLVEGNKLAERVKFQSDEQQTMQSMRGTIYDRNDRELAVSVLTQSLYVDPNSVKDAAALAADLSPLIGISEDTILDNIAQGGGFVWLKHRMEAEEIKAVRKLIDEESLNCLGFREESKRYYPNEMLAANVLGFVGMDDVGLDGIEQEFDALIKGHKTKSFLRTDQQGRPIFDSALGDNQDLLENQCKSVELTLDSTVQFIVEQALDKAIVANNPKAVTAIVMNPQTGEILAMASRPSYNPNRFADYPAENWKNRAISFIYEPGSTFKAVVAAAALQEKTVTPNQVFVDPGYVMVSGRRIKNWSDDSFGTVTFTDVVKNSINTCFAQIGLRLGAEKLMEYANLFGFGKNTDIELPGEEKGILFNPEDMRDSDIATTAIGQSIAVTPLQLVQAMSAIANDGILLKPHIVKSIKNADGSVYMETNKDEVRRTIQSETDKTLVGLLEQVVASGGGSKAAVKGYRIAGKTGTAQKIRENGTGYMEGSYIASFCGFAPVENPQLTVLVMIDEPSGGYYGGQIAAPIAADIFSQLFRYLHIEPSSDPFSDMDKQHKEDPAKLAESLHKEAPQGKVLIPDLGGKSLSEATQALSDIDITINAEGTGIVVGQNIAANTIVDTGTEVTVYLKAE